jgi:surface polysaccharide O-acyltransferase-like enzyme
MIPPRRLTFLAPTALRALRAGITAPQDVDAAKADVPPALIGDKGPAGERIIGLDAVRYLGFIGAVLLHAIYALPAIGAIGELIGQSARFAVPYFFIVAGMFLTKRAEVVPVLRRLLIPFAFWVVVYLFASGDGLTALTSPRYLIRLFVEGGPGFHLWFLPALSICSAIVILGRDRPRVLLSVAAILYVSGVLLGSYYNVFVSGDHFAWNMRDGPFFGLIFTVLGLTLAKRPVPLAAAWALVVVGIACQAAEIAALHSLHAFDPARKDFFFGTLPLGLGAFFIARSLSPSWIVVKLAHLGRYTLGFYCSHILFLWALLALLRPQTLAGALVVAFATVALTTAAVLAAARIKWLSPVLR